MKILYIEHYAGSDRHGMEFRPFYMAREWTKMGHEVTIVAAGYSHLRKVNPTVSKSFTEEMIEGVRFLWVKTNSYNGNGIGRVRNIISFIRQVRSKAKYLAVTYCPDVVINSSTYPLDVYPAHRIAKYAGAKTCYEIHDLWPFSLMVLGNLSEKNLLIKLIQRAEDYCYRNCDSVVSILPDAIDHIKERNFNHVRYTYVPNGVVLGENNEPLETEPLDKDVADRLSELKSQNKFIVMYAGGHARSNALDFFIDSADVLPEGAVLVLVGSGDQKNRLIQKAQTNGSGRVVFLEAVKKRQVLSLLSHADCLYLGALRSELYRYGVGMNKIFDYMLAAKPIIYGVESSNKPIDEAGCGITIEAESASAIADAVGVLMSRPAEELEAMGRQGYDYVIKNHNYNHLSAVFLEALKGE